MNPRVPCPALFFDEVCPGPRRLVLLCGRTIPDCDNCILYPCVPDAHPALLLKACAVKCGAFL